MTPGVPCLGCGPVLAKGGGSLSGEALAGKAGPIGAPLPVGSISVVSQLRSLGATSLFIWCLQAPKSRRFHLSVNTTFSFCCLQGLWHLWSSSSSADPHSSVCMSHVSVEAARSSSG